MAIEKFDTLQPNKSTKRLIKSKLLTALGATGVLAPFPQNPERILERKILLQNPFIWNPAPPPVNPTTLLTSITGYWKMDEAAGQTRADSSGNGLNLADVNSNLANEVGIINNACLCSQTVNTNALKITNALFNTSANQSISYSCWLRGNGLINDHGIISYDDTVTNQAYTLFYSSGSASVQWACFEAGTLALKTINMVTGAALGTASYHHFAFGFDAGNSIIWAQFDNGARSTVAMNGMNPIAGLSFEVGNFSNGTAPQQVGVDELGYWRRVLTTAEVSSLFNGGAALPFSSFGSTP